MAAAIDAEAAARSLAGEGFDVDWPARAQSSDKPRLGPVLIEGAALGAQRPCASPAAVPQAWANPAARFDPLNPTIFHEAWWLQAATGGRYQEVTVQAEGRTVGRLPYVIRPMPVGHTLCAAPDLAHCLGPAIDAGMGSRANRTLKYDAIQRNLLSQLPPVTGFSQKLHRETPDALIFQELGYVVSVDFTYDVHPAPAEVLWAAMRDKTRNVIRRANEQYRITDQLGARRFSETYESNLKAQGLINRYRGMQTLCEAVLDRDRGRVVAALDRDGEVAAAILYVWDAMAGYYLLSTRRADANNGAVSALIWQAMQDCAARGLVFDFDGVAHAGSRMFYTGFGGRAVPRYVATRYSLGHRLINRINHRLQLMGLPGAGAPVADQPEGAR